LNAVAGRAFVAMRRHLVDAAVSVFDSYGMQISPAASGPVFDEGLRQGDGRAILGVIGYVGHKVRGALVLLASRAAVEHWHAAMGGLEKPDVCDTLGEFANMILGNLKGRLLPEGFPILLSTPTTASAGELRLPPAVTPSAVVSFQGTGWRLDVRLDATFEEGFALQDQSERTIAANAGDVMIF
jgi:CheY-specific phosphatase CheX